MSVQWMSAVYETEVGESIETQASGGSLCGSASRKAVLLALANFADEDGYCWPRVGTVAKMTEISERTVSKAITTLENAGYLEVQPDYEPAGRQTSNVYRIVLADKYPPVSGTPSPRPRSRGEGESGTPSTRTISKNRQKEEVLTTPRRRRVVASEFDSDAEGPALGSNDGTPQQSEDQQPKKKAGKRKVSDDARTESAAKKRDRMERAAINGTTAYGQACRLLLGLEGKGYPSSVNVPAVSRSMRTWMEADGVTLATIEGMVDVFVASPQRYMAADAIPWRGFINARQKLVVDGKRTVAAARPKKRTSRYAQQKGI
jgi:hypothetical protein